MTVRLGWRLSGSEASTGEAKMSLIVGRPGATKGNKGPGAPPDVSSSVERQGAAWKDTPGKRARRQTAWTNGGRQLVPNVNPFPPGAGPKPTWRIAQPVLKPGLPVSEPTMALRTAGNFACGNMREEEESIETGKRAEASSGPPAAIGAVRRATPEGE